MSVSKSVLQEPDGARTGSIRRPRQKRSRERFEAILDAAARALETCDIAEISAYTLAAASGMTPPSIYHFFPDVKLVFIALAERYFAQFASAFDEPPPEHLASWQEATDYRFEASRQFYNSNHAARKVLLGSGVAAETRARDLDFDRQMAEKGVAELYQLFIVPEIPDLVDRMTEVIVMTDALWALSVHTHGYITEQASEQARRARTAYLRTILPEFLHRRSISSGLPTS